MAKIGASALMARAREARSLSDFGDDSFLDGLEVLVASANAEARLSDRGRAILEGQLVGYLTARLEIEDWYARHPEIDEQDIVAPLMGLGLPRTGSTALSFLLAQDPVIRYLRNWEALSPCPPPEAATQHRDPRIKLAEASLAQRNTMFPRMKVMVPASATGPTECMSIMAYDFKCQLFQAFAHLPSYVAWLNYEADLVPTYRYLKRVLKLLQWRCGPTNWRLKNPSHILFIDALDKVFPDTRYWMTHRDIASVIPSSAVLYNELAQVYSDRVDKDFIGRQNIEWTELGMRRMIAFRDNGNDHRFFDIQFAPFQKDPFPILRELYAFLGEELTAEAVARMKAWRESTPRDASLKYDAAEYGIDLGALRERFRFYSERFKVETA